jgi:hypothetical protein
MSLRGFVLASSIGALSGCASNSNMCGTIKASDYDQTCVIDADCTAVTEGDMCTGCTNCPNASISVRAEAQYEGDLKEKVSAQRICACATGPAARCKAGVCTL